MGPWIVLACLWFHGTSVDGGDKRYGIGVDPCDGQYGPIACIRDHRAHEERAGATLGPAPGADATVEARSDHAALLVYKGRPQEAIALLESLEQQHPGNYVVAANLGTAYELAGNDAEALRWIREGIKRNPASHAGTEWLHVKILEAKLALARDPAWLETHSVLGLDFGEDPIPTIPQQWPEGQDLQSTRKALQYQLHERLGFVKPPDPVVGSLLADLGSVVAIDTVVEHALPVYDLALAYKPVHADALRKRRAALAKLIEKRRFRDNVRYVWLPAAGVVALVAMLVTLVVLRRRRRKLQGLTAKLAATSGSVISAS
jgi:tetratricopeptide (TPR) repeat protein